MTTATLRTTLAEIAFASFVRLAQNNGDGNLDLAVINAAEVLLLDGDGNGRVVLRLHGACPTRAAARQSEATSTPVPKRTEVSAFFSRVGSGEPTNPLVGTDANLSHVYPFIDRPLGFGRNSLRAPATDLDLRVLKAVKIGRGKLDIVAESFNLLNHHNVIQLNPYFGTEAFPSSGSSNPSRRRYRAKCSSPSTTSFEPEERESHMKIPSHLCSILLFSALTFSGSAAAQSSPSNLPEEAQASNLAMPLPALQQGNTSRLAGLTTGQKRISTTQTAYDGCGLHGIQQRLGDHASTFFHAVRSLPRNAIRFQNLEWELPVMATTVLLIEKGDVPAADRIKSRSLVDNSDKATNIGLGVELGAGALAYGVGCRHNNSRLRETGFTALTAIGEAGLVDLAMKFSFDR